MYMKFAALASLGTLALIAAAPNAQAADNGFYLGAGITKTEFDLGDTDGELDDNSFKVIAGFRPLDWLAVEANYIDLGSVDEDGIELDTSAITLSALALAEFGVVDVYARLGVARFDADIDIDLDVGDYIMADDEPTGTEEVSPLDPQTMTEVGTKLDLARAYIDMGDPEGAKSILEEVLGEGDSGQRHEAKALIDALPG
jgi:FimV-like protein